MQLYLVLSKASASLSPDREFEVCEGSFYSLGSLDGLKRTLDCQMYVSDIFDNVDLFIMFKVPRCLIHIAMVLTTGVRSATLFDKLSCGSAATSVPKR